MPTEEVLRISAFGALFALCMSALLVALPRRLVLLPIVLTTCYMTFGQQIVIAGLHFTILRILVLIALIRGLLRGEFRSVKWRQLDKLILAWGASGVIIYTLLWQTTDAMVNRLGIACNTVGVYLMLRLLIRDLDDFKMACRMYAGALFPVALFICFEKMTGRNPFYAFGGVPEFSMIRQGAVRCQGPFRHPILAGTFGAAWLPLFIGLWWQGRGNRLLATLGIAASVLISILSGSSGPVMTLITGAVGLCMRPMRRHMRAFRWGIIAFLVVLQMVMNRPIWYIFARMDMVSGSTGWHRSNLIDQTVKHFFDWWLLGTKVDNVGSWGVWASDITNQYLLEGITGGALTLTLFIALIVAAFKVVGRALKTARPEPLPSERLIWAIGVGLVCHVTTFLSVSYFDQNLVNWYLLLAAVSSIPIAFDAQTAERNDIVVEGRTRSVGRPSVVQNPRSIACRTSK